MNEQPHAYPGYLLDWHPGQWKKSCGTQHTSASGPLSVFEYGAELPKFLKARGAHITQDQFREQSAANGTPEPVQQLDGRLIEFVNQRRTRGQVLIDSHAATKQAGGFRVTPCSMAEIAALAPTCIVILYVPSDVIRARIPKDAGGRKAVSAREADYLGQLQAAVAMVQAVSLGVLVCAFDACISVEFLSSEVVRPVKNATNPSSR